MPKRLFATLITTLILFSLNIVPANAFNLTNGRYVCSTGSFNNSLLSNYIEIGSDIVVENDCGIGSVNIPEGVVGIDEEAFSGNILMTSVTIPNSVITIGSAAFKDNNALTSVTIGNSVTSIGDSAFHSNTALTSVTIGNSVTSIGLRAFYLNTALTSITIPASVTTIRNEAFMLNTALTSVTIGNSVTSIGSGAFSQTALASVTIPASVTSIGDNAFESNSELRSVTFLGIAAPTVGVSAFTDGCDCATANVPYNATEFGAEGSTWNNLRVTYESAPEEESGSGGDNPVGLDFPWVGDQSISCPEANPWVNEKLDFAKNVKPVLVNAENSVGRTITHDSFESLKSSGVLFDTDSKKVSTATETLPDFGCKDRLLSGKVNQPIQFIAGGYTLQSDAHGYINTADLIWHDLNEVTLTTNTAAFMHTIKFTKPGKYMVVLTEQPDTSAGISPTYGARSIRFVININ